MFEEGDSLSVLKRSVPGKAPKMADETRRPQFCSLK